MMAEYWGVMVILYLPIHKCTRNTVETSRDMQSHYAQVSSQVNFPKTRPAHVSQCLPVATYPELLTSHSDLSLSHS